MVYRLVNSTYNVRELTLRLTRLLCQFIKASSASIYLLDASKKKLAMVASFDNKINILLDTSRDLTDAGAKEKKVTVGGVSIFESHLIGLPLIADDNVGAIFIKRKEDEPPFTDFDRDMLSVFAEQSVTAIKNLQFYEQQQRVILESMKFIGTLLEKQGHRSTTHKAVYFKIARAIAEKFHVGQEAIKNLHYASILHDAGAIDVPYDILTKKSQLTSEEFKIIREHPKRAVELIKPIEFLQPVLPIILYHHERYDGTGYPSGLKKEQIPLGARIMAVVDAFEAMVQGRPYKDKLTVSQAIEELRKHSGTQFDPKVVNIFFALSKQKKFRNHLSLLK
jgi:HD-GYP domain-containing protein (c-di-GMP phosphodiesterase class II)